MKKRHIDEKIIVGTVVTFLAASLVSLVYFIRKDIKKTDAELQNYTDIWNCDWTKCNCDYWNKENWDD